MFGSRDKIKDQIDTLDFVKFLREQYEGSIRFNEHTESYYYVRKGNEESGKGVDVMIGNETIGHLILKYLDEQGREFASVRYVGSLPRITEERIVLTWVNPKYNQRMHDFYEKAGRPQGIDFP